MIFSSILLRLRGQVLFFSGAIDALPPADAGRNIVQQVFQVLGLHLKCTILIAFQWCYATWAFLHFEENI